LPAVAERPARAELEGGEHLGQCPALAELESSAIRDAARASGMVLMREDGQRLVDGGITTAEELLRVTRD
jgi:type II secretory ATPase GspE/PulE/Tfp pilus assembly ATPase PilB-like protein